MAFIVKKTIHGKEYYYLNENNRVKGKVKTTTIAYLGKNKKEAKMKAEEIIKNMKSREKEKTSKETNKKPEETNKKPEKIPEKIEVKMTKKEPPITENSGK